MIFGAKTKCDESSADGIRTILMFISFQIFLLCSLYSSRLTIHLSKLFNNLNMISIKGLSFHLNIQQKNKATHRNTNNTTNYYYRNLTTNHSFSFHKTSTGRLPRAPQTSPRAFRTWRQSLRASARSPADPTPIRCGQHHELFFGSRRKQICSKDPK